MSASALAWSLVRFCQCTASEKWAGVVASRGGVTYTAKMEAEPESPQSPRSPQSPQSPVSSETPEHTGSDPVDEEILTVSQCSAKLYQARRRLRRQQSNVLATQAEVDKYVALRATLKSKDVLSRAENSMGRKHLLECAFEQPTKRFSAAASASRPSALSILSTLANTGTESADCATFWAPATLWRSWDTRSCLSRGSSRPRSLLLGTVQRGSVTSSSRRTGRPRSSTHFGD